MHRAKGIVVLLGTLLTMLAGCATTRRDHDTVDSRTSATAVAPFEDFEWPHDPVFRSAGRIRALELEQEGDVDPGAEQARLRSHFGVVLAWLDANESRSLERAIDRLETARGRSFEGIERSSVEAQLREARAHQRATLERYARRGRFPVNPTPGARSQPIFVDESGTACAVGHLMQVDGWGDAVETIRVSNNGVFVSDLVDGPVLAWVATSGLLIEEAAVIQPTYNGGLLLSSYPPISGIRPPFLFWNAGDAGGFLDVASGRSTITQTEIAFEVAPITAGLGIDAARLVVFGDGLWAGTGAHGVDLLVEMEIRSRAGQLLASVSSAGATTTFAPQEGISVVVRGTAPALSATASCWGNFLQEF